MRKKHDSGYVYVIIDESQRRKLGFSYDAEMRLDILQTGNAERLTVEHRLFVQDMIKAEHALHNLFAADRIRADGEWFKIKDMALFNKIFKVAPVEEREEKLLASLGLR
jgi:hypothetical protein